MRRISPVKRNMTFVFPAISRKTFAPGVYIIANQ
jgi:hypothetical protein